MAIKYLNALAINGNGGTVLDVQGSQGQLFSVTDSLTGDIFAVSDISGVPILKVNSSGAVNIDGTLTSSGNITGLRLRAGDGTDGYFYSDSAGRTAFTGGDFYIQSVTNAYNYATNNYHGSSSGDNQLFRGNPLSGDNWSITAAGVLTATTFIGDLNGTINTATTGVTQTAGDDSTLIATTAYADAAAAAIPIGDYLPLAGGTMANTNLVTNMNADLLDGQEGTFYLDYANFTGTPTIPTVGDGEINGDTSGLGITGSMNATANQAGDTTFTVTSNAVTAATASTIAYRDSSADLNVRLLRANYANQSTISGAMAFRVNNGADNYTRYCSSSSAIRTFLGVPASGDLNSYLLNTTDTFTGALTINGDIRGNGQQLVLNAGESYSYATGQTNEYVYANAEQGLEVSSSPDNWASGWAGRNTTSIGKADGSSVFPGDIKIESALLSNQENTDVDTGAEVVAQVSTSTYTAAFFDFVIKKVGNIRSGTVYACHDGTSVEFTETSTNDLGDTSDVTLSVDISGGNMRLLATVTSDDWSVKSLIRAI